MEDDYLRLVLKKTCWCTCIHPCRIGALIGTAGAIDADRFNLFGFKRYASIDFARATLQQMVQAALDEFDVAYRDAPPSVDRDFIRELIPFLGERDI